MIPVVDMVWITMQVVFKAYAFLVGFAHGFINAVIGA